MTTYKLCLNFLTGELAAVIKNPDSSRILSIPINPENTDYQEYLDWVAEGNEPIAADPVPDHLVAAYTNLADD